MSTYDYDKVMADYSQGRITVEMAMGHSLQHIGKLYEALAAANSNRPATQAQIDALDKRVITLQATIDRLTALQGKTPREQKRVSPHESKQA